MRIAVLLPVLLVSLAPARARAERPDPAAAEALFREGRRAADSGNYAVACPKFEESHRLDPAPGTLLNLGDCEENRGQLARAWQHFKQLYDELPATDERKPLAQARARALEPRLPKLRIVLAAGSARVVRDDVVLGRASLGASLPVDPGKHAVVVTTPGRRDRHYEVSVVEGEEKELSVSSGEPLPSPAASDSKGAAMPPVESATVHVVRRPSPTAATPDVRTRDSSVQRTTAFVVGGVGVAAFVTGAIFGTVALSNLASSNATCVGNVCANEDAVRQFRTAQSFAVAADVLIGVGIAFVGTAVVLALTAPRDAARRSRAATRPLPAWMGGRF